MNKVLGVYFKNNFFLNHGIDNVISCFRCGKTDDQIKIYNFDNLTLCTSENQQSYNHFATDLNEYFYSGMIYPDHLPQEPKNTLNLQKIEHFARLYDKISSKALEQINGKFNFIVYSKDRSLKIYNDNLGLYPLFYYENNDVLIFCNDYEPVLEYDKCIRENLDKSAIIEYLLSGAPQNNKTFFKDIKILPPGSVIKASAKQIAIKRNFPVLEIKKNKLSVDAVADEYFACFKNELNLMLAWYPDIEITLTGGADTRMILGAMSEEEKKRRTFITLSSPYVSDVENQDIQIAEILAKKYNLNHQIRRVPFFNIESVDNNYFLALRDNFTPHFSGFLGSESLRFYSPYPNNISEVTRALITSDENVYDYYSDYFIPLDKGLNFKGKVNICLSHLKRYLNPELCDGFTFKTLKKEILKSIEYIRSPYPEIPYTNHYLTGSFFSRHCGGARSSVLMPCYSTRNMLSPFMSPKLLEIIWSINPKLLCSEPESITYAIYKNHLPELAEIPSNSHLGDYNNKILPKYTSGKHAIYYNEINYEAGKIFLTTDIGVYSTMFNFENIKSDFFENSHNKKYIWADLFLWLNYIYKS